MDRLLPELINIFDYLQQLRPGRPQTGGDWAVVTVSSLDIK